MEAYTLARMAGFDALFVREPSLPPEGVRLLLVPFVDLLAPTWYELQAWVEAGGLLWAGFGGAVPNLEELFGVRVRRRQGFFSVARERTEWRLVSPFGELAAGKRVAMPVAEIPYLPLAPTKARVLAVDEDGHPVLTVNAIGRGKAFFCSCSLEWLLTSRAEVHRWSPAHRLYRTLQSEAGIMPPFETTQPLLSLSVLEDGSGTQLSGRRGGTMRRPLRGLHPGRGHRLWPHLPAGTSLTWRDRATEAAENSEKFRALLPSVFCVNSVAKKG